MEAGGHRIWPSGPSSRVREELRAAVEDVLVVGDAEPERAIAENLAAAGYRPHLVAPGKLEGLPSRPGCVAAAVAASRLAEAAPLRGGGLPLLLVRTKPDRPPRPIATKTDAVAEPAILAEVEMGAPPEAWRTAVRSAQASYRYIATLRKEIVFLRSRLAERRLIDRAKGLLMAHYGLTEQEAYRRLRSQAMNRRQRIGDVAAQVIGVLSMAAPEPPTAN